MENKKYLKVKSIFCAAYITARDILPKEITWDVDGKIIFCFPLTDEVLKLENEFYSNKELQMFLNCYKVLKSKILNK